MSRANVTDLEPKLNRCCGITDNRINELQSAYPILGTITDATWLNSVKRAKSMEVNPRTVLFSGSTPCDNFMLILRGIIRIYQTAEDGREMTLYRVEAGDLCILSLNSMLQNRAFNAIAETETDVAALVMTADDFKAAINGSETFRNYVLSTLTERLAETMYLLQGAAFNHLNMRLACMLGSLFERNKGNMLKITHQDLAHELGTTREVVSRILKEFERQNCIRLSRGYIELASAEGLEWFSQNHS
ncbi:MAG: Crp/Fnr family transcriptional regulator [Gammaproteobacteria bacterium]|nr:MAG: Crp/Fnr family transcriptional regulator [Gammaproteobacteria bacterium]